LAQALKKWNAWLFEGDCMVEQAPAVELQSRAIPWEITPGISSLRENGTLNAREHQLFGIPRESERGGRYDLINISEQSDLRQVS
jgi:hypothetical protein